ncbi:MAG: Sec-independent protein translocase protein TatB [Halofilum sp. (in: g-proteobacteria)]|nr:Sec-independent protein translocase protein TatB [Halofilum sp. (in: g-proteobacteria)]
MFDIGFWEILLIGIVTLLVVGPQRLPGVAVFVGHWIGRIRRFVRNMRDEINEELETEHLKSLLAEQNREISELRRDVDAVRGDTERTFREAEEQVREADPSDAQAGTATANTTTTDASEAADEAEADATGTESSTPENWRTGRDSRGDTDDREEGTR